MLRASKGSRFKAWSRSEESFAGIAYCQEFCLCDCCHPGSFSFIFPQYSSKRRHLQKQTHRLRNFGQLVGLHISERKTEVVTLNVNTPAPVLLDDQALPSAETFTHLGSVVRQDGGTNKDIQRRLSKARNSFRSLNAV